MASKFSYSFNVEDYSGEFDTPEEAVEEAFAEDEDATVCSVAENVPAPAPESYFDARDWLDNVSNQDPYSIDAAIDWDESTKEQRAELEKEVRAVMGAWLDRHKLRPRFWLVKNAKKHVRKESP